MDNTGVYKLIVCQQCATHNDGGGKQLVQAKLASGIGHDYTLTVIANGSAFYLYVNGISVNQVRDATASAGKIGLFCFSASQAAFSNLKVWTL